MRNILSILFIFSAFIATAQTATISHFTFKKLATSRVQTKSDDFNARLISLEAPHPGGSSYRDYLEVVKQQIPEKKYNAGSSVSYKKELIAKPFLQNNFKGNPYNGIPNDNHIAISNDGKIVSVINSSIFIYDESGTLIQNMSLKSFTDTLGFNESQYDPKVVYDNKSDRFILAILNGRYDSTSAILWAFSQTNDPTGDWNLYAMSGNPLNDSSWSDYPMLSVSNDEVFFTINLLKNGGTWQNSFKQTVIWQIDKNKAYAGEELDTRLYSDINYEGKNLRNICPVKKGSSVGNDDCYFLSNRNFSIESDSIFLLHINGKKDDSKTELSINLLKGDQPYGVPPAADQTILHGLQTNDARILDAFIEQDEIWFVNNSVYPENNFAGIYFGKHKLNSTTVQATYIGSDTLEFGYPGIAFTGTDDAIEAMIVSNHSSKDHFPGCGIFYCTNQGISDYKVIKEGDTYINIINGDQRWGDYIGIQTKYNNIGEVWISATYGHKQNNSITKNQYGTWIGRLDKYGLNSVEEPKHNNSANTYPNPAINQVTVLFTAKNTTYASFDIYDMNGRMIHHISNDKLKKGENAYNFSVNPLQSGQYFLVITDLSKQEIIVREAIIVQ